MHLRPDPSTVRIVPWATDPTAQVIHDCYDRDGALVPFAPRSVLRRVCELYDAEGWDPVVAPELEFYLVARNTDPDVPLKPPVGRSGRSETSRQAYSIDAVNEFDPLFEDVYAYCEKMELNVDTLIHEVGAGQMEINFFHAHPLGLADEVFLFKRTVREAALRHDMFATFMAKPIAGEPGSAMHVHQSVVARPPGATSSATRTARPARSSTGTSAACRSTSRRRWRCSRPTSTATAGWCAATPRRSTSSGAPTTAPWASAARWPSRGAAHREPRHRRRRQPLRGAGRHAGLRLPGHQNRSSPAPECKGDAYLGDYQLPRSLGEALALLRDEKDLAEVLGEELRHRLHRGQGDRVRRVHEGDLALGARAPAAARLKASRIRAR
jgi:glutamine synthetase